MSIKKNKIGTTTGLVMCRNMGDPKQVCIKRKKQKKEFMVIEYVHGGLTIISPFLF